MAIVSARDGLWLRAMSHGAVAGVEHLPVFGRIACQTVIDIGANRGQFALVARHCFPDASVISFEPLPGPARVFRAVFGEDSGVVLHEAAIGPQSENRTINVSAHDDSSSLLPISQLQSEIFPGTESAGTLTVRTAPLGSFVSEDDIRTPAMLKLDVQGFELEALRGCESLLPLFDWVYCECSFVELYEGQALAGEVIDWLALRGYMNAGVFNPTLDRSGRTIQADFLFRRGEP